MTMRSTAVASPNIALIKYWGNTDNDLRLPVSPSISFNLAELHTTTTVEWDPKLTEDSITINDETANEAARDRVSKHLDLARRMAETSLFARVVSENNFPTGTGIASSAAAFAALSLAATNALSLDLTERELSTMARIGSGSASRSIPGGFVAWYTGKTHKESFAASIAPPNHWNLVDLVAVVSAEHKKTGSYVGHHIAHTSPLQDARIASAQARFDIVKSAILKKDFAAMASVIEQDNNVMHAVMMTGTPSLFYWEPSTLGIMKQVRLWREEDGLDVCYTVDAGPNVHCICTEETASQIESKIRAMDGVIKLYKGTPGGPATIIPNA